MTFKAYLQSKGHSKQNVDVHYRYLNAFINWTKNENIETELASYGELLGYIKHLQKREVKQRTIQLYVNSLNHYFKWITHQEIRQDNPTKNINIKGIKRRTLYHLLDKQELEALYHNFKMPEKESEYSKQNWYQASILTSKRNKVILGLIVYQGLCTQELGRLTVADVKLREGKIYIGGCRRSNERELKLEPHQILDFMEYMLKDRKEMLTYAQKETEKLFTSIGSSKRFNNIMQKLMPKLKAQNSKITAIQQLRTSVITHWLKNHNLREVQYMAGHRYVSSTEAYLINDLDSLQEDIAKFHPF